MSHDIIPDNIWEGPPEQFLRYIRKLDLEHWLCKHIVCEYAVYHNIIFTFDQLMDTCPVGDSELGRQK